MTDEAETDGAGGSKKSSRWKSAIQRTKTKLRNHDDDDDKTEFKLSDDVNDFLQAGRPSTSDSFSASERSATPPDKLFYLETDQKQMARAGLTSDPPPPPNLNRNITPPPPPQQQHLPGIGPLQKSPRGIPVPRLDVSNSQRWPKQQELGLQDIDNFLHPQGQHGPQPPHPKQHQQPSYPRSQSQGPIPRKKKNNSPRNLSVTFLEAPPTIIGEGGDEAETPPSEISRAWGRTRARSVSPMPSRSGEPQHVRRKQVPPIETNPSDFEPRRLGRVGTGFPVSSTPSSDVRSTPSSGAKSVADMEFDMILQPPTPGTPQHPPSSASSLYVDPRSQGQQRRISPNPNPGPSRSMAQPHPPSQFQPHPHNPVPPHTNFDPTPIHHSNAQRQPPHQPQKHRPSLEPSPNRRPRPALASQDLRMQYEEGQALRHSHYRGLSNTSGVEEGEPDAAAAVPPAGSIRNAPQGPQNTVPRVNTGSGTGRGNVPGFQPGAGTGFSPLGDDPDIRYLSLVSPGKNHGVVREMTRRVDEPEEGAGEQGGWI